MVGMRADVTLNVNTSKAKRSMDRAAAEINRSINGVSKKQISFNVNGKSFTQPLGRITASANEFTKSLEASNARVIAFGASVGIINGISEAFKALVVETVKFEKVLQDINVIVGASAGKLQEFGDGLFDVARNTAQAFTVSAEAALEFSRQGLTMEETLKRTNDALILTRLTGLDAASAVSGLTAAVNAFGDAGLSTTDIIDKLAAVDVKFAVSSEDLIKALERTGAVAIDAGVEIDSLIGLVTALQQTTARGGAVIGNGLKTIFTRIQRPESIRQLEEIGIAVKNLSGSILPADKIMINMAKSFDNLSQSQQSNIVQFSAGIFQANVFRAALRDLGKEQSIQAQATEIAGNAAGDAAQKNEMLNKTMSAMASQTTTSIQELAEILGTIGLAPDIDFFLSSIKDGIDGIKNTLGGGEDEGSTFAKGLVKGIGNVITGPAAIAFGAIFIKLFVNIAKFARTSLKDVLGIVNEKDKIRAMEESILKALGENVKLQEGLSNLEDDRKAQEMFILGIIEKQNSAMSEQVNLAARLAKPLVRAGINPDFSKNEASGMVPVAASGMIPESSKKKERQGAAQGGYAAGAIDSMNVKGVGTVVYNKAEKVKQFPGMSQPAIMPPKESRAGKGYKDAFAGQHGFDPYASGGFVPNFATMNGGKLMLDPSLTQLSANPGKVKGPRNLAKSYAELEATGQPISVEATTKQLLSNTGGSHSKKVKEVIRYLQDEGGVQSIERKFKLKKLPKRGKKTADQAEADVLEDEGGKYFNTGGRSGDPTFPVDLVGLGMNPIEVKSGEWKLPNVLLKSLRLYSDDGLMRFAESQGATQEMINEARNEKFKKGANLLTKKGLIGKDASSGQTHQALLAHRMSEGLVPNFAKESWEDRYKRNKGKIFNTTEEINKAYGVSNLGVSLGQKNVKRDLSEQEIQEIKDQKTATTTRKGQTSYPDILKNLRAGKYKNRADLAKKTNRLETIVEQLVTSNKKSTSRNAAEKQLSPTDFADFQELLLGLPGGAADKAKLLGNSQKRGRIFEEILSDLGGVKFETNPDAMDFSRERGRLLRVPKKTAEDIGLEDAATYGDAHAGAGHKIPLMRDKIIREVHSEGLLARLLSKDQVDLPGDEFPDIVNNGSDSSKPAKITIKDLMKPRGLKPKARKAINESIMANHGYTYDELSEFKPKDKKKPTKEENEKLQLKKQLDKKIISFNYVVDDVDLGAIDKRTKTGIKVKELENLTSANVSGGLIPNFADPRTRSQKIQDTLADPSNKGIKFNKPPSPANITSAQISRHLDIPIGKTPETQPSDEDIKNAINAVAQTREKLQLPGYENLKSIDKTKILKKYKKQAGEGEYYGNKDLSAARGFVPNFAKTFYDFDETLATYPSSVTSADLFNAESAALAEPTDLAKSLKGRTLDILTARAGESKPFISKKLKSWGINSGRIITTGSIQNGQTSAQKKATILQNMQKKNGGRYNLIDDAPENIAAIKALGNKNLMGQLYKFSGQHAGRGSGNAEGLVPNFADPLSAAISRERAAGVPQARIRVEKSSQLKSAQNPMGLAVTNTRDEPAGVQQGIRRAKTMGIDPKKHGASKGMVPNFASPQIPDAILNNAKNELSEMSKAFTDSFSEFSKIASQFGKEGKETLAEIASFDISKDFEGIKDLLNEKLERTEAQINSITEKTGKLSKGDQTRLGELKKAKSSGEALLKSTEEKSQKSKAVKNLSSSEPEAQKAQLIKSENAMIKKMLTARGTDLKSLKEATKASQDFRIALDESAKSAEESEDDGGGLQRLFYLQSAISLVNGQFETLAEGASGLTKTFAQGMLAISNVTASYIQQKELVSEGMNMAGVKRNESFSIGQAFNPEARAARRSAAAASDAGSRGSGVGRMGGLMRNLSGVGKMFGRFLPVIGQLYTGFTVVNEAFKMFNIGEMFGLEKGSGVMDLLSSQGERAAKKLEKLGESTEKLQGALESLNSQTENREKVTDLEILGSRRTQKQELELQQLKLKGLDIDIKAQDALSGLLDENLVGTKVSKRFIEELSKGTNSNEDYVKVIERVIKAQKNQAAFLSGSKSFGDLIDKKLDKFNPDSDDIKLLQGASKVRGSQIGMGFSSAAAGGDDMDVKDRLSILNKNIAALERESSTVSFRSMSDVTKLTDRLAKNLQGTEDFDAEMMASQINSFIKNIDESIDNTSGLDPRETKAVNAGMKQMVIQLNKLKKNLEGESDRQQEAQLKKEYVTAYKNIIFNIEQFRKNEAHLTKLSLASLAHQNKLNSSQQSLLLEYGAIGKQAAISSDFARKRNAMEAKFSSDKQGVEMKTIESLNKLRDTYFNTDQLAQQFKKDGQAAAGAVQALKENIEKGVSAADFAGIGKSMNLNPEVMAKVTEAFEQTSAETKNATSSLEVISSLLNKFGKATDSSTASALLLALHEKKLVTITDEHLNLLKSGLLDRERQLEYLNTGNKEAQQLLKLEEEHKFIKEKTVAGAAKLYKILQARGREEKDVLESVKGEAATLAVLNDFYKKDVSILAKSSEAMELGFQKQVEKNRTDAISAVHSLRMLEAQTGSLKGLENSLIILEAKLKSETENAKLALQESNFRLEYLSDQSKRSELVKRQLAKEMSDLQTSNLLAAEKNLQLSKTGELRQLVEEQLNATLHSSRLEALTAAENALLLTGKTKQVKLIQEANELQEASNKLTELQNAVTKAGVSDKTLRMTTTADIGIEKANSILGTRTAGMKATVEPNADNMLAYANSLEQTNKLLGNGSRAIDRFRARMAEMNVEAENLGADLVNIGIDNARSGLTQMFKDIGSGAKSASEAWADFGLGLANELLDRLMQNNVDKIIKNLTFAFTGESGESDAIKIAKETAHLVGINEGIISSNKDLTSAVRSASEALRNKIQLSRSPDEQVDDFIAPNAGKTPDTFTNVQENAAKIQTDLETSNKMDLEVSSFIENLYKTITPLNQLATAATEATKASMIQGPVRPKDLFEAQDKMQAFKDDQPLLSTARTQRGSESSFDHFLKGPQNKYEVKREEIEKQRKDLISNKYAEEKKAEKIKTKISEMGEPETRAESKEQKRLQSELEKTNQEFDKFSKQLKESDQTLASLDSEYDTATKKLASLSAVVENLAGRLNVSNEPPAKLTRDGQMDVVALLNKHSGGKIQHFAKGGFVDGPAGVDKVPAMLTAGEYVVPKDKVSQLKQAGGMIQHFRDGTGSKGAQKQEDSGTKEKKEKSRFQSGMEGIANLVVMNEVSRAVADSLDGKTDSPPTFDENKFKNLDLRSDVNIKRGDPRLSSKFLSRDPAMQQYKDFLLEKAAYDVQKKNEKFEKRKATLATVVGAVQSMAIAGVTAIAAPFIQGAVTGLENTYGRYAPTDSAKAYRAARAQDPKLNVNYRDVKNSMKNNKPLVVGESSYFPARTKEGGFTWDKARVSNGKMQGPEQYPSHRFPAFNEDAAREKILGKKVVKKASGGSVPAMLTAGEGFIPEKTAKRIGYENLNTMNKTGNLPTVQGAPGIDQVGPVGLTEGDFIIKKNSTDKLLRENPSMMKFALQNPEGFKKGERGYYEGGVVGNSSPATVAPPAKPRSTNRIQQQNPAEMLNSIAAPKTQSPQAETQGKTSDVTNNINVNVTIDQSGQEKVSSDSSGGSYEEEQNLSLKIKTAVLDVIRQEKRIGGELN